MRYSIRTTVVLLTGLVWLPITAAYASGDDHDYGCDRQRVHDFNFFETGTQGQGKLCVLPGGLRGDLILNNLVQGNAYTVWWTYLDDPAACQGGTPLPEDMTPHSECDILDFFFPEGKPLGTFGRMASGIAPRNGRLRLRGSLGGMQPSSSAEVWFWVFTHGPAEEIDGAALARQLLTPEDPGAGAPHLGNEVDGQQGFPAATVVFKVD